MIIHLNGWPGAGKLTVGRILATKLSTHLVDNHTLHNTALCVCEFASEERWTLYYSVRKLVYDKMRAMPTSSLFVMTNGIAEGSERDREAWEAVKALAADRNDVLVSVTLAPSLEENMKRIATDDRRNNRKLTDPSFLQDWCAKYKLLANDVPYSTVIDNTHLAPEETAERIDRYMQGLGIKER